jgi:rhodanese-related sulfurtransferase
VVEITASTRGETDISPQEFLELSPKPLLIDVRSELEYSFGHATGAVNLSLPRIMMGQVSFLRRWVLPEWFRELPRDRAIALICLTAHRSPMAATQLVAQGYHTVYNVTGGMREWWKLSLPTHSPS